MKRIIHHIRQWLFARRFRREVRRADRLAKTFGIKYLILLVKGKPRAIPKQNIRRLVAEHTFRPGVTVQDICRRALYTTH